MVIPLLSLEVATPDIKLTRRGSHPYASPPHKRFLVGCSSPLMRLAGHLTALWAWYEQLVGENPACSVPAL